MENRIQWLAEVRAGYRMRGNKYFATCLDLQHNNFRNRDEP